MGTIEEMMGNYNNEGWGMGGTSNMYTGSNTLGAGIPDFMRQGNIINPSMDTSKLTPKDYGVDLAKGFDFNSIGSLFSSEKGGTSVMGGLAPYMQMGMSYLADKKNDHTRANNEAIQRQQIASNTYNADKLRRNDAALGRAFGTA
jgi:hypothetical protein